jgi:hypothetical protein
LLQACLISYFWVNSYLACAGFVGIALMISISVMCLFNKPIVNYMLEEDQEITNEMLELQSRAQRRS